MNMVDNSQIFQEKKKNLVLERKQTELWWELEKFWEASAWLTIVKTNSYEEENHYKCQHHKPKDLFLQDSGCLAMNRVNKYPKNAAKYMQVEINYHYYWIHF